MQETCLVCEGSGRREPGPCPYCEGKGRLKVHGPAPQTVLVATGSCKVPVRKAQLPAPPSIPRLHTA